MTAEAIAVEPTTATRADLQESEGRLSREIRDSEASDYTASWNTMQPEADLKDTELRLQANIRDTELRLLTKLQEVQVELQGQIKDAQMWLLLLRLGGLIVAAVTIAVAVLKLLS